MRVCVKHMAKAVLTLTDKFEGAEYDLCQKCKDDFWKFVIDPENKVKVATPEVKRGRKRTA